LGIFSGISGCADGFSGTMDLCRCVSELTRWRA
jgi:hypothetical protein